MDLIQVLLEGCPALGDDARLSQVTDLTDAVKLPRAGGYEHFRFSGRHEAVDDHGSVPVFSWCARTAIAE